MAFQMVLAEVDSRPNNPSALVFLRVKAPGLLKQLEKDGLADILGVVGAFQVGIAQPQDQV